MNFTLTAVIGEPRQLTASWTSPLNVNGILRNYTVSCRKTDNQFYSEQNSSPFMQSNSTDGGITTVTITGLEPFTEYQCQVTASTDAGESVPSNNDTTTTTEDAPTAPVGLMSTSRTATTISLQWNRPATPNGIINMYTLTYSNTTHSLTKNIPVEYVGPEYNVTNITIDILNEFTNYTFNLTATTGGGTGPAATLEVQTNEAGKSISCIVIVY